MIKSKEWFPGRAVLARKEELVEWSFLGLGCPERGGEMSFLSLIPALSRNPYLYLDARKVEEDRGVIKSKEWFPGRAVLAQKEELVGWSFLILIPVRAQLSGERKS